MGLASFDIARRKRAAARKEVVAQTELDLAAENYAVAEAEFRGLDPQFYDMTDEELCAFVANNFENEDGTPVIIDGMDHAGLAALAQQFDEILAEAEQSDDIEDTLTELGVDTCPLEIDDPAADGFECEAAEAAEGDESEPKPAKRGRKPKSQA